jgi:hypothetical protein
MRIAGRRTTMRLSAVEEEALRLICAVSKLSIHEFCTEAVLQGDPKDPNQTRKVRGAIVACLLERWRQSYDLDEQNGALQQQR